MTVSTSVFSAVTRPNLFLHCNLCSPAGQGIPDISAQAVKLRDSHQWRRQSWGRCKLRGTGASSSTQLTTNVQIAAGIISLLNDYQISRDKPPRGFLNPWLYGDGLGSISDITSGSNPGCNTDVFSAIDGWDPVRPARLVSLHFRRWLILGSVRSRVLGRQTTYLMVMIE